MLLPLQGALLRLLLPRAMPNPLYTSLILQGFDKNLNKPRLYFLVLAALSFVCVVALREQALDATTQTNDDNTACSPLHSLFRH